MFSRFQGGSWISSGNQGSRLHCVFLMFWGGGGVEVHASPTKQCSMASNKMIFEEFRCEHKSAYKTTISPTRVNNVGQRIQSISVVYNLVILCSHFRRYIYLLFGATFSSCSIMLPAFQTKTICHDGKIINQVICGLHDR